MNVTHSIHLVLSVDEGVTDADIRRALFQLGRVESFRKDYSVRQAQAADRNRRIVILIDHRDDNRMKIVPDLLHEAGQELTPEQYREIAKTAVVTRSAAHSDAHQPDPVHILKTISLMGLAYDPVLYNVLQIKRAKGVQRTWLDIEY